MAKVDKTILCFHQHNCYLTVNLYSFAQWHETNIYKKYELLPIDQVQQYTPKSHEEIKEVEHKENEETQERRTKRRINKEGVNPKENIVVWTKSQRKCIPHRLFFYFTLYIICLFVKVWNKKFALPNKLEIVVFEIILHLIEMVNEDWIRELGKNYDRLCFKLLF